MTSLVPTGSLPTEQCAGTDQPARLGLSIEPPLRGRRLEDAGKQDRGMAVGTLRSAVLLDVLAMSVNGEHEQVEHFRVGTDGIDVSL